MPNVTGGWSGPTSWTGWHCCLAASPDAVASTTCSPTSTGLRSDSDTEHDLRRSLIELDYPVHPEPFPFRCDDDVVVHLDLALPAYWVYLEVDGFGTHRKRRVFEADRVKWTQVVRHWRPVWVTASRWQQDRGAVLADLDAAIADADPSRAPAVPQP